ncbi:NACHT domain-containing protein [Flavobacterium sp.]|uniref:NACHT domain-containing protein n=1 Tax=Flavobacterium sp. TaxID=239 RepID=UPI00326369BD
MDISITDFKKLAEGPISTIIKKVGIELQQITQNRLLEYQTIEYRKNYFTKTLLHRTEPVRLMDFYQPLFITPQTSINSLKKSKKLSTANVSNLFEKTKYITLIGSAGSGKSTIVKYLFINSVEISFKIPIKIELRYLNEYKGGIVNYIFNEIFLFQKLGLTQEIIERLLNSDSFIFFFDGYDEINSTIKESVTRDIDGFISRFPENNYLITSRPYTNIDTLPLFSNYEVCDLDDNEIRTFVKKQVSVELELADKINKAISNMGNGSYKQFLSNPLLLSMFILTFQSYSEVPQKKSDFYGQVFDTLYSLHDSVSKLSYVREKLSGLSKENYEDVLSLFSCISYFDGKFIFNLEYLENTLNTIKSTKNIHFANDKLIEDLQVAIGILNKEGLDYTFPHRSLQEYFAAKYITSLSEKNKNVMYSQIKSSIIGDWFYALNNYNFLTLLAELDHNTMILNLSLPLIEAEIKFIVEHPKARLQEKYNSLAKLYLCKNNLLNMSIREELIHLEFCKGADIPIYYDAIVNNFQSKVKDLISDKKQLDYQYSNVLKNGMKWIESIKKNVEDQELSDTAIIKLISKSKE